MHGEEGKCVQAQGFCFSRTVPGVDEPMRSPVYADGVGDKVQVYCCAQKGSMLLQQDELLTPAYS
jgi:hypothetical protein